MIRPSGRVRLLATDLDGTLLRDDLTISERTRQALDRAREAGVLTVAVTARPPRRVLPLFDALGLRGMAICANGALLYDVDRRAVVRQTRLAADLTCALIARLRLAVPGVAFAIEAGISFGCETAYVVPPEHAADRHAGLRSDDAAELCADGVTKLIVQHAGHPFESLLARVREHAGEHAHVTHSSSAFVEISAAGITKAAALAEYCAERGVHSSAVIAVGDMPNDLPMLQWAGWGVAVANAHAEVLAACDARTLSNNDDGVAALIEELARRDYEMPLAMSSKESARSHPVGAASS